jgi:hypothetical protein
VKNVARAHQTTDHEEIRAWVERQGGRPAQVAGTGGMLRIDFGEPEERLEPIEWDRFFEIFDQRHLAFLYDPRGHMTKFVEASGDDDARDRRTTAAARGPKKNAPERKKTSSRKKTSARKKTSPRKTTSARKTTSSSPRKKTTGTRKKSATSRKKSTSSKKTSSASSKKSGGRKYGKKAGKKVERSMHEMKEGKLRSGTKGPKVKSRKQAIAIGLSEARREGDKVPSRSKGAGRKKKSR